MRGRVLAVEAGQALVRGEREDLRVPAEPSWRAGDLIDGGVVVRAFAGGDYPGPATEVARLPRARMQALQGRAKALAAMRGFFAARDFTEVETPLIVPSPGLEIHLDAVPAGDGFLHTSPEYAMKRLIAAGFERIYTCCKCFRGNEHGPHHAGEFTMIEWYRAFADLEAIIRDTEELVATVVTAVAGRPVARLGGRDFDVTPPWPRMTVAEAMRRFAHTELSDIRGDAWDDAFFQIFLEKVDPAIAALDYPLILCDWPAPLAALARKKPGDPSTALRFEAYVGGLELANAFDELTDPVEQRARFLDDQRIRRDRARAVYPLDEKLLAALAEGLPPSGGIALGFDRLVMLATGSDDIAQVLAFTGAER